MGVSQRVFIPLRASKYMLESIRVFDFEGCTGPTEVGQLQKFFIFLKL